jgi:hypothetical protein
MIRAGKLDARSPLADARLDYKDGPRPVDTKRAPVEPIGVTSEGYHSTNGRAVVWLGNAQFKLDPGIKLYSADTVARLTQERDASGQLADRWFGRYQAVEAERNAVTNTAREALKVATEANRKWFAHSEHFRLRAEAAERRVRELTDHACSENMAVVNKQIALQAAKADAAKLREMLREAAEELRRRGTTADLLDRIDALLGDCDGQ